MSDIFKEEVVAEDFESNFDPIPDGKYVVRIIESEAGESKAGDPLIKINFEVAEGTYEGRRIYNYLTFGQKAKLNRLKFLEALGVVDADHAGVISYNAAEYTDKVCVIDVVTRPAKGEYSASNSVKYAGYEVYDSSIGLVDVNATKKDEGIDSL